MRFFYKIKSTRSPPPLPPKVICKFRLFLKLTILGRYPPLIVFMAFLLIICLILPVSTQFVFYKSRSKNSNPQLGFRNMSRGISRHFLPLPLSRCLISLRSANNPPNEWTHFFRGGVQGRVFCDMFSSFFIRHRHMRHMRKNSIIAFILG